MIFRIEKKANGRLFVFLFEKKLFSTSFFCKKINENDFYRLVDKLLSRKLNREFDINRTNNLSFCYTDLWSEVSNVVDHKNFCSIRDVNNYTKIDFVLMSGMRFSEENYVAARLAEKRNIPIIIYEDGFLRSASTYLKRDIPEKYWRGISFTFDCFGAYFDSTRESYLEKLLNNKKLIISKEEISRAKKCIKFIRENKLTKYNHQPIFEPKIGRDHVEKILVVDQSYGDMAIKRGAGSTEIFNKMLDAAIKENPGADIIVKTHPDTIAGRGGYFTKLISQGNLITQKTAINPISLIDYVDKVYVCSTQLGFEALICGKDVHVFGLPFYAGWGLTKDYQKCLRRHNTRSLEEIFYITYILYTRYYNPVTGKKCEIEDALNYLLNTRNELYNSIGSKV